MKTDVDGYSTCVSDCPTGYDLVHWDDISDTDDIELYASYLMEVDQDILDDDDDIETVLYLTDYYFEGTCDICY